MSGDRSKELLVDELGAVVGEEAVERADLDVDRALARQPSRLAGAWQSVRLLLLVVAGALLVTGVIASLALDNWVFLGLAILAHALFSFAVIGSALALSSAVEKPSPTAEAALEDEGVSDPSRALNDLVEQVADEPGPPEHDAASAAVRPQASTTPASEPSRTVGQRGRLVGRRRDTPS